MDFKRLEDNIIDVIKEQQAKLGYRKEIIRLYYPLTSLNHLAGCDFNVKQMSEALKAFSEYTVSRLGNVKASVNGERFCIEIPCEGSEYVHNNTSENEFIVGLVDIMSKAGCTIEQVIQYFKKYSENVVIRHIDDEDFDYAIFFEQSEDKYIYCFKDEGCHIIYHRFLPDDYNELFK